jgi:hypothetical protein
VPTNVDVGAIDLLWVHENDAHVSPMGAKGKAINAPARRQEHQLFNPIFFHQEFLEKE